MALPLALALVPALVQRPSPPSGVTRRSAVSLVPQLGTLALTGAGVERASQPALAAPAQAASSLSIPPFGVGAWAWGDTLFWGYDQKKDGDLSEVFDYCVDNGVTFFDTAEVYGLGRSEQLLGQFCKSNAKAKDVTIATKFAALPWRTKASDVIDAARRSTDRLGRPIDLYQIHFPSPWANEKYWDGLGQAVDEGLVRAAGVSNYGVDALRACHEKLRSRGVKLQTNQIQLSLLYPYALSNGLKAACDELGVNVLSYSPLALGLLTGKYTAERLPSGPRKGLAEKYFADPAFGELTAAMAEVGRKSGGANPAQVALAWCIAKGTTPIPGARTLSQAQNNLGARSVKLTAADVATLDAKAAAIKPVLSPAMAPFPKEDIQTHLRMFDS